MQENLTDITVVLDKSGSMNPLTSDVIGGFNQFLKEQQELPGQALMTLILFDTTYKVVFAGIPVRDVKPLDEKTYRPGGATALLDAMARAITEAGARFEKMKEEERPGRIVVLTMTDGHENSSSEHTKAQLVEMKDHQENVYNWHFVFIGANVDAFAEAHALNIRSGNAMNFGHTKGGVKAAFACMSSGMNRLRSASVIPCSATHEYYTADEQKRGELTVPEARQATAAKKEDDQNK
jgi:uncharacterized protein YegL